MLLPRRAVRAAVLTGTAALIAGGLVGAPAVASAPSSSVTVLLKAPNPAALDRLATASGLSHAQRVKALDAVLPSAASHAAVVAALRSQGFAIDHQTAWTIDATATQPTVTRLFGLNRIAVSAEQTVATGALPDIPANLSGLVAAVLPSSGSPTLFQPKACPHCNTGSDFRDAYTGVDDSPPTGQGSGGNAPSGATIATLQFANWNSSDLTQYAANTSAPLGDPVASGQYVSVPTGGTVLAGATKGENGADEEVDLDQESILSTDPYANQRAYFNTDSTRGYVDDLSQVIADVTEGPGAKLGGDPHIVALSTSWGSCESQFGFNFPGDTINAIENLLKSLTAAGVTVFAASGDDGVYDCGLGKSSTKIAVDYPASSPEVIGVGGTKLTAPGGRAANAGSNWSEAAWTCADTTACEGQNGSGGSGGGESGTFAMPTYQTEGIGNQPFKTTTGKKGNFGTQPHRLVPDIAADGDPNTGFQVLTSDPVDACRDVISPLLCNPTANPVSLTIGGTSLASPLSAALFTNLLSAHGLTAGIGDIHAQLYSAYAAKSAGAVRDVTSGRNGSQHDVDTHALAKHPTAAELPVNAQKGFDTVTGIGGVLWTRIEGFLFSPQAPRGTALMVLATPHSKKHKNDVRVHWGFRQRIHHGILGGTANVVVTRVGSATPVFSKAKAPATGTLIFTGKPGAEYQVVVTPTSLTKLVGTPASAILSVPLDETRFSYKGTWVQRPSSAGFGPTIEIASSAGAIAKATATGKTYSIAVRTGPAYGILQAFKGSALAATIDLYSPKVGHKVVTFWGSPEASLAKRTFTFAYSGKKNPASSAKTVDVDALYISRA